MSKSPLPKIKNLVPVDPAWYQKLLERWNQGRPQREQAMRDAAQREEVLRRIALI